MFTHAKPACGRFTEAGFLLGISVDPGATCHFKCELSSRFQFVIPGLTRDIVPGLTRDLVKSYAGGLYEKPKKEKHELFNDRVIRRVRRRVCRVSGECDNARRIGNGGRRAIYRSCGYTLTYRTVIITYRIVTSVFRILTGIFHIITITFITIRRNRRPLTRRPPAFGKQIQ